MKAMNYKLFTVVVIVASLGLSGCSSAPFKVVSEPDQAEVFIVDSKSNEEKLIGQTPLLKKKQELVEYLKDQNSPGSLVNIVVKKDGFKTKSIFIPLNGGGNLGTALNLKLSEGRSSTDEMKTASEIVDQLFLAQQFARTNQLERAAIEIEKILVKFPKFDRAMTMKAAILYAQGEFRESLQWYENAVDLNPQLKNAVKMAGKIRQNLKIPARLPAKINSSDKDSADNNKSSKVKKK